MDRLATLGLVIFAAGCVAGERTIDGDVAWAAVGLVACPDADGGYVLECVNHRSSSYRCPDLSGYFDSECFDCYDDPVRDDNTSSSYKCPDLSGYFDPECFGSEY